MQETLTDKIRRSLTIQEDIALFDDLRERGMVEIPDMWIVEAGVISSQRFAYIWERDKAFWMCSEERHYDHDQAVKRGLAIILYQNHDLSSCQRDEDLWARQIARPVWALNKLREERGRWGWEWDDPERRKTAQERDTSYHNTRYAPVIGVMKGQIWRMRWQNGDEVYAMVTSLLGGCARLSGYYTVLHSPTYCDRPRDEVRAWRWGEYRCDQQQINGSFGPGKWAELVEG